MNLVWHIHEDVQLILYMYNSTLSRDCDKYPPYAIAPLRDR